MTAGFQVINDAGTILIDENYKNISMKDKRTVTIGAAGAPQLFGANQFTVASCVSPVVFIQCSTGGCFVSGVTVSGGTATITVRGPAGVSVTVFTFDEPTVGSFGLQVYNASGQVVFDSSNKYARVVDVVSGTTAQIVKTYTSGRTYAVAYLKKGSRQQRQFTSSGCGAGSARNWLSRYSSTVKVAANVVTFDWEMYYDWGAYDVCEPRSYNSYTDTSFTAVVIDVTGY